MSRAIDTIAVEANRMYWETDTPVAEIAQQLELSRRALYEAVEPLPTSSACPTCGSPLVYENRSARNAGVETCPNCEAGAEPAGPGAAATADTVSGMSELEQRAVRVGGAALAGAALGAIATLLLVPRR